MSERNSAALPSVAGRMCEWSINEFVRRCLVCIQREQEKPLPDNDLIDVLCNAVRLGREHGDFATKALNQALKG
jgi:hypothetical protein